MLTSKERFETEEYAVYSSLIESWFVSDNTRLIVIEDQSGLGLSSSLQEILESLTESFPTPTKEILADFKTKNRQASPLKSLFSLTVPYVLINNQEMDDIFQIERDGWDEFYRRYPNSQGMMALSRVGFNPDMNQALVYVGNQSHWRAGTGHLVLLIKEDGTWKIQGKTMVWIS
jgi:hypothetical protein